MPLIIDVYHTCYTKKPTLAVRDDAYVHFYQRMGRRRISRFLEELARERLKKTGPETAYREMTADEARESEAAEWIDALAGDAAA